MGVHVVRRKGRRRHRLPDAGAWARVRRRCKGAGGVGRVRLAARPAAQAAAVLPARAALEALRFDSLLCAVAACNVAQGVQLSEKDCADLVKAAARIQLVAEGIVA